MAFVVVEAVMVVQPVEVVALGLELQTPIYTNPTVLYQLPDHEVVQVFPLTFLALLGVS
tara:strand:- start:28 stop:204 length:177 start_codon:yes stop_codon:yes gene_type:complete